MNVHEVHALTRHQQELIKVREISRHADSLERIHEEQMRRVYDALDKRMKCAKRWGAVVTKINEIKQSTSTADMAKQIASLVASEREEDNKPEPARTSEDETVPAAISIVETLISPSAPQHVFSLSTKAAGDGGVSPHATPNLDRQSLKVSFSSPLSIEHPITPNSAYPPTLKSPSIHHLNALLRRPASSDISSSDDSDDLTDLNSDLDDDGILPPITPLSLSPSIKPRNLPQENVREDNPIQQDESTLKATYTDVKGTIQQLVPQPINAQPFTLAEVGILSKPVARALGARKTLLTDMLAKYRTLKQETPEDDVLELSDYDSNDDASSYADSLDDEDVDATFEVPDAKEFLGGIGNPNRIRGVRRIPSMKEIVV
ncbi:uncharacterized protein EI90DRAFT_3050594 [Cantharellus anzutake]|uniref:uncharacterized protein n=1 Tax=Cantharellus anzutake TaxID=1750568 RepID=UPI001903FD90|nr:uncharacterized protein EI90DRAFT_3050594 [Cantharellus anzutake]KAF8333992.1 hypothetical protein EI90DRAFT_3050594 [Cantharellus anzutake]